MLNVNQMTMENYRVVKNIKKGSYYFVSANLIKKDTIESVRFEILKEDDPLVRQMFDEFTGAPIIDWTNLVYESEHYLYYAALREHFWDWEVLKK